MGLGIGELAAHCALIYKKSKILQLIYKCFFNSGIILKIGIIGQANILLANKIEKSIK
jgi:hypothetical protein